LSLFSACARQGPPAPLVTTSTPVSTYRPPVADIVAGGGRVVVHKGQTLYAVARSAGVPLRSLIDANHLQPPYHIHTGQTLIIPPIHGHLVQRGETLYRVARQYGVEASTLVQLNHLTPPYFLKTGQLLTLPPAVMPAAPTETASPWQAPVPVPAGVQAVAPAPPVVPAQTAAPATLTPLPTVELGTNPVVPVTSEPAAVSPPPAAPPVPLQPPTVPASSPTVLPGTARQTALPPEPPPPNASEARVAALVAAHAPPDAPLFYWPVRGRIIAVFGSAPGGTHNDGINIAAPRGTIVSAAENGTVAYAGDDLKGFGNLLLIKHPGGWISAYAHNDVLLVKRGERVRRGQAVARVGDTGGVGAPQLHFELRQLTKPVDPLDHLPQLVGGSG
jgi:murein DD-endopeptidase MepM/ murein hydrolase activator NlpD